MNVPVRDGNPCRRDAILGSNRSNHFYELTTYSLLLMSRHHSNVVDEEFRQFRASEREDKSRKASNWFIIGQGRDYPKVVST
jgi:hypothetical protein